jgi:hypothetical protein
MISFHQVGKAKRSRREQPRPAPPEPEQPAPRPPQPEIPPSGPEEPRLPPPEPEPLPTPVPGPTDPGLPRPVLSGRLDRLGAQSSAGSFQRLLWRCRASLLQGNLKLGGFCLRPVAAAAHHP